MVYKHMLMDTTKSQNRFFVLCTIQKLDTASNIQNHCVTDGCGVGCTG